MKCEAFDYESLNGTTICEDVIYENKIIGTIFLKVLESALPSKRPPRFTSLNTRINEMYSTESFIKSLRNPADLWCHPLLVGYVDVSKGVEIHIDRSDFGDSNERDHIYGQLSMLMDNKIRALIEKKIEGKSLKSYDKLSSLFQDAFSKVAKLDDIRLLKEFRKAEHPTILLDEGEGVGGCRRNY